MRIPQVKGISAVMKVDGATMAEYAGPDWGQTERSCTKYVEAFTGSSFAICAEIKSTFKKPSRRLGIRFDLDCDGKWLDGLYCPSKNLRGPHIFDSTNEKRGGDTVRLNLAFGDLATHDGDKEETDDYLEMGQVILKCTWITIKRVKSKKKKEEEVPPIPAPIPAASQDSGTTVEVSVEPPALIPEKNLKGQAISQKVILNNPTVLPRLETGWSPYTSVYEYPEGKRPFANFIFKYRSRADLQKEGVIPRDPLIVKLEDRDPDDLTLEELREQNRLLRGDREVNKRIKHEPGVTTSSESSTFVAPIYVPGKDGARGKSSKAQSDGDIEKVID